MAFLIRVHALQRIILIAHQDCAFYRQRLGIADLAMEQQQQDDLSKVVRRLRQMDRRLHIETYFADFQDGTITFEKLQS